MQLYKTTINDQKAKWSGSQADAAKDRNALWDSYKASGGKRSDITTTPVDVPTNKQGLIEFLNELST